VPRSERPTRALTLPWRESPGFGLRRKELMILMNPFGMVARDGIEPPTPAFSERGFQVISTTYKVLRDCLTTWKYAVDGSKTGGDNG
jgi:hypothetical protein